MSITLNWMDNSYNERGFVIERSTDGSSWSQYYTASIGTDTYIDINVTESNTYWYRLFSFNESGTSSYSATASLEYTASAPASLNNHLIFDQNGSEPYDTDISAPSGVYTGSTYLSSIKLCSAINCDNLTGLNLSENFSLSTIDVSGSINLTALNLYNNLAGSPAYSTLDLSTNTALTHLNCGFSTLTTLNLTANTVLQEVIANNGQLSSITLPSTSTLTHIDFLINPLTTIDISVAPNLIYVDIADCLLSQAAVDGVLSDLVDAGLNDGYLDLSSFIGINEPPSAGGYDDVSILEGRGWEVYTN